MSLLARFALAISLFLTPAAHAQQTVDYASLTQSQQISAIQALIERGEIEEAQLLLSSSRFDEGDAGYQAAFLQAVIYRIRGDFAAAEDLLRRILAERPEFRLVRLELAQVLAAQGRRTGAGYQFGLLADTATSTAEAREFDRLMSDLDAGSGFEPSVFLTLAPSTNFNNGATAQTVLIGGLPFQITNTAQSGVGVRYGGALTFTNTIGEDLQLFGAIHAQRDDYKARVFDVDTAGVRAGLNWGPPRDRVTVEIFGNRRWVDGEQYDEGYGARFELRRPLSPRVSANLRTSLERRDYDNGTDSIRRTASLSFSRALSPRASLRLGARVDEQDSRVRNLAYHAVAPTVGAAYRFSNGLTLDASLEREARDYELTIFGVQRQDTITRARLAMQWDRLRIGPVVPLVTLVWTDNASTLVPFEFEAQGVELTFSQAF